MFQTIRPQRGLRIDKMQKQTRLVLAIGWLVLFAFPATGQINEKGTENLEKYVENSSRQVLAVIKSARDSFEEEPEKLYEEVDHLLSYLVDFDRISKGVMGSYFKTATADQRERFSARFRKSMVELFTKTLIAIDSEEMNAHPAAMSSDVRAAVTLDVKTTAGESYTLVYSMVLKDDHWLVGNMVVNGLNLGLLYRNQFKGEMTKSGANLETVIGAWSPDVGNINGVEDSRG